MVRGEMIQLRNLAQLTLETILDNVASYIYVIDPETNNILFANKAFQEDFTGAIPRSLSNNILHKKITDYCQHCSSQTFTCHNREASSFEIEMELSDREETTWLHVHCRPIDWLDGTQARLFTCHDISPIKYQDSFKKKMAFTDGLTGLPNRHPFKRDLEQSLARATEDNSICYLLYMNLDNFKTVTNGYGPDYGDGVLVAYADFLRTLGVGCTPYRLDGDEFALILEGKAARGIHRILDKLLVRARKSWEILDRSFYCTVSIGVAGYPAPHGKQSLHTNASTIIKDANIAMQEGKRLGKNNYLFYNRNLYDATVRRNEMERMIRSAISKDFEGFVLHYQPWMDAQTNTPSGAEALIRWFNPAGDLIRPDHFIPLSEYLGLIVPLGDFILKEAVTTLKHINDTIDPHFTMSVNMSIRQLQQPDIVTRVARILEETDVMPHNLIFEVTEGIAATEFERIRIVCDIFRDQGISIAMDDFGTGYSSLGNMRSMPIDMIKIDRCFIRDVPRDNYSHSFIKLITNLGHNMGKLICIEGVETPEQATYCHEIQADIMQGFHFFRPLPLDNLVKEITVVS